MLMQLSTETRYASIWNESSSAVAATRSLSDDQIRRQQGGHPGRRLIRFLEPSRWPRSPFFFSLFCHVPEGTSLVRSWIADNSIRFSPVVIHRQVLCHRLSFRSHEQQAVAVLVDLHIVTGAYPGAMFHFGFLVGIEAARAQ